MAIKDATFINKNTPNGKRDVEKLREAAKHVLDQVAKVDPNEVEAIVVSILNKNNTDNLVGMVGNIRGMKDCTTEIVLRIAQLQKQAFLGPRDDGRALDPALFERGDASVHSNERFTGGDDSLGPTEGGSADEVGGGA